MRLSEASAQYFRAKEIDGYSPETLKAYRLQHRLLMKHIGDPELEDIETNQLREYIQARVPPGWYYSFTITGATLANAQIQGE